MINISIIIPHHNIPELLTRCISTIPVRTDIETIIVDDNSNPNIVDFNKFPGKYRNNTKVIFTKEGKGAGYARNIGLKYAKGRWIMFTDSDDFFLSNAFDIIGEYIESKNDIIYFNTEAQMNEDLTKNSSRMDFYKSLLSRDDINYLRFQSNGPMLKLIKREIIYEHNISFDETQVANDIYFSLMVGILSKKISVEKRCIMCITERTNSLMTHQHNIDERITRFKIIMNCNQILNSHGLHKYCQDSLRWYFGSNIRNVTEWLPFRYLIMFIFKTKWNSVKYMYWSIKKLWKGSYK